MKKVLIVFLVFAYMNCYMSCAHSINFENSLMGPNNYSADKLDISNNDRALEIVTIESQVYYFEENTYTFKNDTIIGQAFKNDEKQKKWIKIAFTDISNVSEGIKETDLEKSFIIAGVLILIPSIVLLILISVKGFGYSSLPID